MGQQGQGALSPLGQRPIHSRGIFDQMKENPFV